ncbi:MAG: hypothetical protein ABSG91_13520 [Syntrophobacteraceae bacterium]|jgi:hypothetical protein
MVLKTGIQCRLITLRLIIFLLISGLCAFVWAAEEKSVLTQSIRQELEQKSLEEAMSVFNAGDYRRAKILFEILSDSAQSPEIGRQALFGLASIKLVLAQTSDEYADAVSSWKKWKGQVSSWTGCEDPRMLTPFLLRLEPAIKGPAGTQSRTKGRRAAKDVELRESLQTKEKEMKSLRSKLETRDREIRRLRHQLESLEEIHRKYQEKKQEATQ